MRMRELRSVGRQNMRGVTCLYGFRLHVAPLSFWRIEHCNAVEGLSHSSTALITTAEAFSVSKSPSHFAITTVARQLPSTLTEVRAMSIN